jgi:hypothetical protein
MRRGRRIFLFLSFFWFLSFPSFAHASENLFGFQDVNAGNIQYFPLMAEIGIKWVRTNVYWSDIEPIREDPPRYHWEKYDELFKRLVEMGFTPIITIAGNPSWISTYRGGPFDKGDVKDYLRFVKAMVERYDGDGKNDAPGSPKIVYWEIYNEPDLTSLEWARNHGWGFWGNEPIKYANLLKAVYPVIKGVSKDAQMVFGGIALDNWTYFNSQFLDKVLKAGAGPYFDIMNFHYYFPFHNVWDRYGPDIIGKTNYIRDLLASYGLRKDIFCTEMGIWSEQNSSLEFQASYLTKLFIRGMAADLKSMIWFTLVDFDTKGMDPTRGVFDTKMNKKPSYHALKHLTSYMKEAVYRAPLSFKEGGNIAIDWDWKERLEYRFYPHSVLEGYSFYKPDVKKDVSVLWSNSREFGTRFFGKSIRIYDHYGKEKELKPSNGNPSSIKLTSDPIFVEKQR